MCKNCQLQIRLWKSGILLNQAKILKVYICCALKSVFLFKKNINTSLRNRLFIYLFIFHRFELEASTVTWDLSINIPYIQTYVHPFFLALEAPQCTTLPSHHCPKRSTYFAHTPSQPRRCLAAGLAHIEKVFFFSKYLLLCLCVSLSGHVSLPASASLQSLLSPQSLLSLSESPGVARSLSQCVWLSVGCLFVCALCLLSCAICVVSWPRLCPFCPAHFSSPTFSPNFSGVPLLH